MNFQFKEVTAKSLDLEQIKNLFQDCKWDWPQKDSEMLQALENSFQIFTVTSEKQIFGFARTISDGKIYALLVDVMIHPSHQKKGLAEQLTNLIIEKTRERGIKVIQLLASTEGRALYKKAGFTQCPESSPGMVRFLKNLN